METVKTKKRELSDTEIAIALIKGGLSWDEAVAVINRISFDQSAWNGSRIVKTN